MEEKYLYILLGVFLTLIYVGNYEKDYHCEKLTNVGAIIFGLFTLYKGWNCNNIVVLFLSVFLTWHLLHAIKIIKQ